MSALTELVATWRADADAWEMQDDPRSILIALTRRACADALESALAAERARVEAKYEPLLMAAQQISDDAVPCPREGLHEVTGLRELRTALRKLTPAPEASRG